MDLDKLGGRKTEKTTKDSCVAEEQRSEYWGDHGKKSRLARGSRGQWSIGVFGSLGVAFKDTQPAARQRRRKDREA
jgi:hypothetical protein